MLAVQEGKVAELGSLFHRHQRALFRYFYHLSRDQQMSEDLVQEVFIRLLRSAGTYRPGGSFQSWMYQIGRSAYIDLLRKKKPEAQLPQMGEEGREFEPASGERGPEELAQADQEVVLVRQALDKLPPEKRELLIMTRYQELSYSQIAEITNSEVATVKVRIHRALEALRREYRKLNGEEAVA